MESDLVERIATMQATRNVYRRDAEEAWLTVRCGHCGGNTHLVVAHESTGGVMDDLSTRWLKCVSCRKGSVMVGGRLYPGQSPLRSPKGLPGEDQTIWSEVRACMSAGAYTAAVMLCRRLLLHIAVAHGLASTNERGFAPSFTEAVQWLEEVGIIATPMKAWVDRIKDVGNQANHEITPIDGKSANDVATFTQQLLILAYEMQALSEESGSQE